MMKWILSAFGVLVLIGILAPSTPAPKEPPTYAAYTPATPDPAPAVAPEETHTTELDKKIACMNAVIDHYRIVGSVDINFARTSLSRDDDGYRVDETLTGRNAFGGEVENNFVCLFDGDDVSRIVRG